MSIPKVHKEPTDGWSFTECGLKMSIYHERDLSADWDDVTCKSCLRTKARRERFASRPAKEPGDAAGR